jgi:uncharacterized tellurite resistance protein B-like protein
MADPIHGFFENEIGPDATPIYTAIEDEQRHRLHIAACALLLELAHADEEFSDVERTHIHEVIVDSFGLNADSARALVVLTERERAAGKHVHEFADLIASRLDAKQKTRLVELMWRIALSDGTIAQHESFLMARIGELLGLPADELASARDRVERKPSR